MSSPADKTAAAGRQARQHAALVQVVGQRLQALARAARGARPRDGLNNQDIAMLVDALKTGAPWVAVTGATRGITLEALERWKAELFKRAGRELEEG